MYIITNALRSLSRSVGRNILIGIIVLIIAASACVGLSIRRAADRAKETGLETMTVTAQISIDVRSMMNAAMGEDGKFDRENFSGGFDKMQSVNLEELKTYASAESVSDFYYTVTLGVNGSDTFEAVTSTYERPSDMPDMSQGGGMFGGGMPGGGKGGMFGSSSDFSIIGYSSEAAMTSFANGTTSISDGEVFEEGTTDYTCIISSELATFNSLAVGDTVTITNPNNEEETYVLTVVGFYESTDSGEVSFGGGRGSFGASDPTNRIYMSAAACEAIVAASEAKNTSDDDTALSSTTAGTYVFPNVESYEQFEEQARALGMPDEYTVSSSDVTEFEQQLVPLETLSTFAWYFLIIVLIIGAAILIVLNLFNIRERKYEVGVLTAIGMKKSKVAMQFVCETLAITVVAVLLGGAVGAVSAVPITNALLEQQITSQQNDRDRAEISFGRGEFGGQMPGGMEMGGGMPQMGGGMPQMGGGMPQFGEMFEGFRDNTAEYVSEINSATDWVVLLQLLAIGMLLSVVSSLVSVVFIMRYDPLKILANRD